MFKSRKYSSRKYRSTAVADRLGCGDLALVHGEWAIVTAIDTTPAGQRISFRRSDGSNGCVTPGSPVRS